MKSDWPLPHFAKKNAFFSGDGFPYSMGRCYLHLWILSMPIRPCVLAKNPDHFCSLVNHKNHCQTKYFLKYDDTHCPQSPENAQGQIKGQRHKKLQKECVNVYIGCHGLVAHDTHCLLEDKDKDKDAQKPHPILNFSNGGGSRISNITIWLVNQSTFWPDFPCRMLSWEVE